MQMKISERFAWAVEVLNIKPTDTILEIGCGTGILVEQIARKLTSGQITAIDQSPALIKMASKRNKEFILRRRVELLTTKFAKMQPGAHFYNKIFAFNVSLFWKNPIHELKLITSHLANEGVFYLFHQPPIEVTKEVSKKAIEQLKSNDYEIVQTIFKRLKPVSAFCIISKPNK